MEKTLKSTLIHKGKNINFLVDEVELDHKKQINREIVEHPGAVAILPLSKKDKIILINQYRGERAGPPIAVKKGVFQIRLARFTPVSFAIPEAPRE